MQDDVVKSYKNHEIDTKVFLKLPQCLGGHLDLMLGIKYLRHYPDKVFQLQTGLTIYRSWFKNAGGTRHFIGEPYKILQDGVKILHQHKHFHIRLM